MKTIGQVSQEISQCQASSEQCWEMAIETAETPARKAAFEDAMNECNQAYEWAIDCIDGAYQDYAGSCRVHLERARGLEKDGGDDQHARRALAALADLDPDASE
jgi:7-cyano-7-deazaguanine synthase in queuosine biosynthesis